MTCIRTSADAFRRQRRTGGGNGGGRVGEKRRRRRRRSLVTGTTDVTAIHRRTEPCFLAWSISQCTHNTHRQGERPPNCRTTNRPPSYREPVSPGSPQLRDCLLTQSSFHRAPDTGCTCTTFACSRRVAPLHIYIYIYTNTEPRCLTRINEIQW